MPKQLFAPLTCITHEVSQIVRKITAMQQLGSLLLFFFFFFELHLRWCCNIFAMYVLFNASPSTLPVGSHDRKSSSSSTCESHHTNLRFHSHSFLCLDDYFTLLISLLFFVFMPKTTRLQRLKQTETQRRLRSGEGGAELAQICCSFHPFFSPLLITKIRIFSWSDKAPGE